MWGDSSPQMSHSPSSLGASRHRAGKTVRERQLEAKIGWKPQGKDSETVEPLSEETVDLITKHLLDNGGAVRLGPFMGSMQGIKKAQLTMSGFVVLPSPARNGDDVVGVDEESAQRFLDSDQGFPEAKKRKRDHGDGYAETADESTGELLDGEVIQGLTSYLFQVGGAARLLEVRDKFGMGVKKADLITSGFVVTRDKLPGELNQIVALDEEFAKLFKEKSSSNSQYSDDIEGMLDQWVAAKRAKDFRTADSLREELRAQGVDPDEARPPLKEQVRGHKEEDHELKAKLDRWVAAKRDKDFDTADAIRAELREQGVEPDKYRPHERFPSASPAEQFQYDPDTEAKLDMWVEAKRDKNFELADQLRSELRAEGIEPDKARPSERAIAAAFDPTSVRQNPAIEAELDRWQDCIKNRDFETADAIRAELRAKGIEPDKARPPAGRKPAAMGETSMMAGTSMMGGMFDLRTEAKLDHWQQCVMNKDFARADALRADLRAQGIEPDQARPKGYTKPSAAPDFFGHSGRYDPMLEAKLDRWQQCVQSRDFKTADMIRAELRQQGVEPERERPKDGSRPGANMDPAATFMAMFGMMAAYGWEAERQLDRWQAAMQQRDYATADMIRAELRKQGIEPEQARPKDGSRPTGWSAPSSWPAANSFASNRSGHGSSVGNDWETEQSLDRWQDAMQRKDFATADMIRAQLRRKGIEPDQARPKGAPKSSSSSSAFAFGQPAGHGMEVEKKLDRWQAAIQQRDFDRADSIRAELRMQGIEPDIERPKGGSRPSANAAWPPFGASSGGYDVEQEMKLDRWQYAMQQKDFNTADSVRAELRRQGVEPDKARPKDGTRLTEWEVEKKLDRWQAFMQSKEFDIADMLRADLRKQGVEPDKARPKDGPRPNASAHSFGAMHDSELERTLDRWQALMQQRDFDNANIIRADLRKQGIEPEKLRPRDGRKAMSSPAAVGTMSNWAIEMKLDQWQACMQRKDYATADAIRAELRMQGIEPDKARPKDFRKPAPSSVPFGAGLHDPETEAQLDRWVEAKRLKDFRTADAIRAELRSRGIEPDEVRPPKGTLGGGFAWGSPGS